MIRALLFIFATFISLPLQANEISALRFGQHPDKTRIVIELDDAPEFQAKIANKPNRLEILLPEHDWAIANPEKPILPFQTVDHTITQDGLLKISLPLNSPYIIQSAFIIEGKANRLVIDMKPSNDDDFVKNISALHGPLNIIKDNTTKPTATIKPLIMIDAGHGGIDGGAVSPKGIKEKQITLPLALRIAETLNQSGQYDAHLTRNDDTFVKLYDRVKIARESNANIFISIHADSVGEKNVDGASVYTLSNTASDSQTEKLAFRENNVDKIGGFDIVADNKQINDILFDLSTRETMDNSKRLANLIVADFQTKNISLLKSPHRYANFAVLTAPDVPSILIEAGFVSNDTEAEKLLTSDHQAQIATSIKTALDGYFGF